jgi:hypothetical protein
MLQVLEGITYDMESPPSSPVGILQWMGWDYRTEDKRARGIVLPPPALMIRPLIGWSGKYAATVYGFAAVLNSVKIRGITGKCLLT